MKSSFAHPCQVRPVRACPSKEPPFHRTSFLVSVLILAAFLLSACGNPTKAAGPALLPTIDSTKTVVPPTALVSTATQSAATGLASSAATVVPSTGATLTPWPTNTLAFLPSATPAAGTPWPACAGSRDSRLRVGAFATVSKDPPQANNVREAAGVNQLKVGQIQPGERVKVIDGPVCVEHWTWWKIQSQDAGLTGWTAEGDEDNYWLVPEN